MEAWSPASALDACGMPHQPHAPPDQRNSPSGLFNAMIHPLLALSIFGAVFYQGEHDSLPVNNSMRYSCTFPRMVRSWRDGWHRASGGVVPASFSFGFVQLSDVNCKSNQTCGDGARYGRKDGECGWPNIRWGQTGDFGYVPNPALPARPAPHPRLALR